MRNSQQHLQQQQSQLRRRPSSASLLERDNSNVSDATVAEGCCTAADETSHPYTSLLQQQYSSSLMLEEESQPETLETSSSSDVDEFRASSSSRSISLSLLHRRTRSSSATTIPEQNADDDDQPPKEVVHDNDQWNNIQTDVDVETYMAKRSMTAQQERWNAMTILPNPIFCVYYLWTAAWLANAAAAATAQYQLQQQQEQEQQQEEGSSSSSSSSNLLYNNANEFITATTTTITNTPNAWWNGILGDEHGCLPGYPQWHTMPALPPLPVVAVAVGIALHAPFSFLYHWKYAQDHGAKHWSRRMDQAMIHVCSACMSFAATGSWKYFVANLAYNLDCCYRLFSPHERPLRNQVRIIVSMIAYTLPMLLRGEVQMLVELWLVFLVSGWFFAAYPVGGWSHTVFHLVIALAPRIMLRVAVQLEASAPQLQLALHCRSLREQAPEQQEMWQQQALQ